MRPFLRLRKPDALLIALLALVWTSCGSDKPFPTTPSTLLPTVRSVSISGNAQLTTVGDTSQLTATATMSDGTTIDVTGIGGWTVMDSRVANISTTGLLTVLHLGATQVSFGHVFPTVGSRSVSVFLTATPPGTVVILGGVREPGAGPVASAQVQETVAGGSVTTDLTGSFSLAGVPGFPAHLKVQKDGYEPAESAVAGMNADLPIQKIVRLVAGDTVKPDALAPHDLSYDVNGSRCDDCRLIRVMVPQAGTVHVRASWTGGQALSLFVEGQVVPSGAGELTVDLPVSTPREMVMYLGAVPPNGVRMHTPFTFETSLR